jgi:hypothetical protein
MLQKKQKNTKAKREKPNLTRRGLTRISTDETVEGLRRKHTAANRDQKNPRALRLDELRIANQVFQWRRIDYDIEASTDHVLGLARSLANNGKPLKLPKDQNDKCTTCEVRGSSFTRCRPSACLTIGAYPH